MSPTWLLKWLFVLDCASIGCYEVLIHLWLLQGIWCHQGATLLWAIILLSNHDLHRDSAQDSLFQQIGLLQCIWPPESLSRTLFGYKVAKLKYAFGQKKATIWYPISKYKTPSNVFKKQVGLLNESLIIVQNLVFLFFSSFIIKFIWV